MYRNCSRRSGVFGAAEPAEKNFFTDFQTGESSCWTSVSLTGLTSIMPARKKAAATASKASSSKATSSSSSTSDSKPVKRLSAKTAKKDEKETAAAPDKQIVKVRSTY